MSAAVPAAAAASPIVVVGSANADLCCSVARLPVAGETVLASALATCAGGKGANQAAAAARLLGGAAEGGPRARLVALFGEDASGASVKTALRDAGVDLSLCRTVAGAPTGTALVLLLPSGENSIVVAGGANQDEAAWAEALGGDAAAAALFSPARPSPSSSSVRASPAAAPAPRPPAAAAAALLLQREVPEGANERAAGLARAAGAAVVLDAGGADVPLSDGLLPLVTVFSPNETELERLCADRPPPRSSERDGDGDGDRGGRGGGGDEDEPLDDDYAPPETAGGGPGSSASAAAVQKLPGRAVADAWSLLGQLVAAAEESGDRRPRAVLLKLGASGAALFSAASGDGRGAEAEPPSGVWQPALRPDGPVVDTTGAGDCFTAAFAVARFAEGLGAREALRFATAAACLCVQRPGAQPSMPRREEVEGLLRRREGEAPARTIPPVALWRKDEE